MNKIKKVLFALDYDPTAQKLSEISCSMAKAMNDKVVLLHVVSGQTCYSTSEYFLKIGNNGTVNPESLPPHSVSQEKEASHYFLILGE